MNDTPMDIYVKEYLIRHILTSGKYNPQDPALEERFNAHMWELPLNSMEWDMAGSTRTIILTKEKLSYTINWTHGKAHVKPTNDEDKGIIYELGGDFGMLVYRYMLSCPLPVETPPARMGQLVKHFFAGKHDIVDDVTLRQFKSELVRMANDSKYHSDVDPVNYKGVATRERVVLTHQNGATIVYDYSSSIQSWTMHFGLLTTFVFDHDSKMLTTLCTQIEQNYSIYI